MARLAASEIRSALPQRSPKPLIVPCTCAAPASTAASELATARSQSLWQWMPTGTRTAAIAARVSGGDFLGHAAAVGVAEHDQPCPGLGRRPDRLRGRNRGRPSSRRRNARRRRSPRRPGCDQVGDALAIMARFSSPLVRKHFGGVEERRLAHQRDHRRAGVQQGLQPAGPRRP